MKDNFKRLFISLSNYNAITVPALHPPAKVAVSPLDLPSSDQSILHPDSSVFRPRHSPNPACPWLVRLECQVCPCGHVLRLVVSV